MQCRVLRVLREGSIRSQLERSTLTRFHAHSSISQLYVNSANSLRHRYIIDLSYIKPQRRTFSYLLNRNTQPIMSYDQGNQGSRRTSFETIHKSQTLTRHLYHQGTSTTTQTMTPLVVINALSPGETPHFQDHMEAAALAKLVDTQEMKTASVNKVSRALMKATNTATQTLEWPVIAAFMTLRT